MIYDRGTTPAPRPTVVSFSLATRSPSAGDTKGVALDDRPWAPMTCGLLLSDWCVSEGLERPDSHGGASSPGRSSAGADCLAPVQRPAELGFRLHISHSRFSSFHLAGEVALQGLLSGSGPPR